MSTVNLTVPHYGKDTVYVATVFSSTSYVFSLHAVVVDMNKRLSLLIQFTVSTLNNYNTKDIPHACICMTNTQFVLLLQHHLNAKRNKAAIENISTKGGVLPPRVIPASKHFFSRHDGQFFLLSLSIVQSFLLAHKYFCLPKWKEKPH